MPRRLPRALRLPLYAVAVNDGLVRHVARTLRPGATDLAKTVYPYAFKSDERAFALSLLRRWTQLWLFRAHQAAACGDFLLVDLSPADPARRPVLVLELKLGKPVRPAAGWQTRNATLAVAELAARGIVHPGTPFQVLTGDATALLAWFAARGPGRGLPPGDTIGA